jgi:hypothetical protein
MEYALPLLALLGLLYYLFNRSSFRRKPSGWRTPGNADLVRVLLNLERDSLEQLFSLYEQQFGEGPARYARQTYRKWKAGDVRPNKQTYRRFLINLPKVMSFDLRCEVLRELREAYCARDYYRLSVHTDDWKEKLTPLIESLLQKRISELPDALQRKLTWLAEDDAQLASKLLDHSQQAESLNRIALLETEFSNIVELLDRSGGRGKVTHTISLPYGTIELRIRRRDH